MSQSDWREETQIRLKKNPIYLALSKKCEEDPAGNQVLSLVDDACFYAYQKTKSILMHMGQFTLHDGDHLFRVLSLMARLLGQENIEKLSVPELMLLILSAFFHDIGMAPEEKEVLAWKKVWDERPEFNNEQEEHEYRNFLQFYMARISQKNQIEYLINQGKNSEAELLKSYLITEYIRITHAARAKNIIAADWINKIMYQDTDITVEFASICFSHNEDAFSLFELDKNYLCGQGVYANFQLVAVVLRLADLLDFDAKRTPTVLFSHLFVRHPVSLKEWSKHRSIEGWDIGENRIQFHAKCNHPAIEASIHSFCDVIDKELSACNNILSEINSANIFRSPILIKIPFKVDRTKVETKKDINGNFLYLYRGETQFNLSKNQVIDLLMGTKLYGNPQVALRELIQNSIDACLLRKALENKWGNLYEPEILVKYSSEEGDDVLEVIDNGIGMDQNIIEFYYAKMGSSFYNSAEFYDLKYQTKADFTPTSRFGIGVLSCFMVADSISVDTRKVYGPHDSSEPMNITIEGRDSIFWIKNGKRETPGTSTKLYLRKGRNPWDRMSEENFIQSVETVIPNPPVNISIKTDKHSSVRGRESFKSIKAESLKNHSWDAHENIREFKITFDDKDKGFIGEAIVAILESHGEPVDKINMTSRSVEIDGENFSLEKSMRMSGNEIATNATSITIDEDGRVQESTNDSTLCKSRSMVSLHGIEIPTTLFPEYWLIQNNQVKLSWAFPMLIVLDVCGNMDLDLNSPRTQIIMSDKWLKFEKALAESMCEGLKAEVTAEYWDKLKKIFIENTKNEIFINVVNRL